MLTQKEKRLQLRLNNSINKLKIKIMGRPKPVTPPAGVRSAAKPTDPKKDKKDKKDK